MSGDLLNTLRVTDNRDIARKSFAERALERGDLDFTESNNSMDIGFGETLG